MVNTLPADEWGNIKRIFRENRAVRFGALVTVSALATIVAVNFFRGGDVSPPPDNGQSLHNAAPRNDRRDVSGYDGYSVPTGQERVPVSGAFYRHTNRFGMEMTEEQGHAGCGGSARQALLTIYWRRQAARHCIDVTSGHESRHYTGYPPEFSAGSPERSRRLVWEFHPQSSGKANICRMEHNSGYALGLDCYYY